MPKRSHNEISNNQVHQPNKKHHGSFSSLGSKHSKPFSSKSSNWSQPPQSANISKPSLQHEEAVEKLPPETWPLSYVPGYIPFTVPRGLPELPLITDASLATAPFKHKSAIAYSRSATVTGNGDLTYERLEFLGDAYIELFASRLIFSRFSHLPAGQMSQLRELLVKNETLWEYGCAYGLDKKVQVADLEHMQRDSKDRGNKGFKKVIGDVFEAYIAAVVLSDPDEGFAVAEKWMTALWAPKLYEAAKRDRSYGHKFIFHGDANDASDPRKIYNPAGKADLQRRIMIGSETKLSYEPYQASVELKGDQLGQSRHFIALYLTGYGYERKLLGKGEGKNKVEAGNWAANEAMHGDCKSLIDRCEQEMKEIKAERAAERAAQEEQAAKE